MTQSDLLARLDAITNELGELRDTAGNDPAALIAVAEMFCKVGETWARILRAEADADELARRENEFGASEAP